MSDKCERCAVLEDLLETARIQVEHARHEAEKADDEARGLKAAALQVRSETLSECWALVKEFQARAEAAEAKLAAALPPVATATVVDAETPLRIDWNESELAEAYDLVEGVRRGIAQTPDSPIDSALRAALDAIEAADCELDESNRHVC